MAFLSVLPFFSLLILLYFSHTTLSQKCTSQTLTNNKLYKNCTDLPTLNSFLHYTYDSDKSSLSVAFIAPPAKSDGWIGWGINLNGTGMVGAQVLIAYKKSNGEMSVKTYNLVSYASILQSKLSFDVSDKSAEYSDGVMRIFAKLKLPKNLTRVNQVWQVGASVEGGVPAKHEFQPANLNAKGELKVGNWNGNSSSSSSSSTIPIPSSGSSESSGKSSSSSSRIGLLHHHHVTLLFILGSLALYVFLF